MIEQKILSFKEVHAELEMENNLLLKEHNIVDFSSKADFLNNIVYTNSKATKMYQAIVSSEGYRKEFNQRYHGMYKFILTEQLERVCEKYNLYVRPLRDFAGDIPEKNIQDMMDCKFYIEDLIIFNKDLLYRFVIKLNDSPHLTSSDVRIPNMGMVGVNGLTDHSQLTDYVDDNVDKLTIDLIEFLGFSVKIKYSLDDFQDLSSRVTKAITNKLYDGNMLNSFRGRVNSVRFFSSLQIGAVENLFLPSAFEKDSSRLGLERIEELAPTGQVDLDPIVMIKNNIGYIIITAWGDEANDELIVNQKLN